MFRCHKQRTLVVVFVWWALSSDPMILPIHMLQGLSLCCACVLLFVVGGARVPFSRSGESSVRPSLERVQTGMYVMCVLKKKLKTN